MFNTVKPKMVRGIVETYGVSKPVATLFYELGESVSKIEDIDGTKFIVFKNGAVGKIDESVADKISLEYSYLTNDKITVSGDVSKLDEMASELQTEVDPIDEERAFSSMVTSVISFLHSYDSVRAVNMVREHSFTGFVDGNKRYDVSVADGNLSIKYTNLGPASRYTPPKLTESKTVDSVSEVISILESAGYFDKSTGSNFSDHDYGLYASGIVENLDPNSKMAVLLGKSMLKESKYAYFSYSHPYIKNQAFVVGVNLDDPNKQIGLTESSGSVLMNSIDTSKTDLNESSYKPLMDVHKVFLKSFNESVIVDSHKDLI